MKSQGTFEYILLLGGVIVVVLLVIVALMNAGSQATTETNQAISTGLNKIKSKVQEINLP